MRFAHVHRQKIRVVLIVVVDLNDIANLAAERRSGEAAEDENKRPGAGALANVETVDTIKRDEFRIRSRVAGLEITSMHVRQGVAQHVKGVSRATCHHAQDPETGHKNHTEYNQRPLGVRIHLKNITLFITPDRTGEKSQESLSTC